jgi:hypothetical protein
MTPVESPVREPRCSRRRAERDRCRDSTDRSEADGTQLELGARAPNDMPRVSVDRLLWSRRLTVLGRRVDGVSVGGHPTRCLLLQAHRYNPPTGRHLPKRLTNFPAPAGRDATRWTERDGTCLHNETRWTGRHPERASAARTVPSSRSPGTSGCDRRRRSRAASRLRRRPRHGRGRMSSSSVQVWRLNWIVTV